VRSRAVVSPARCAGRGIVLAMDSLRGKLLVASPGILDPSFFRTVVLIGHHDEDGALGLVLNRPSEAPVADAAPPLADVAGDDGLLYLGGPVQPEGVVVMAEFVDPADAAILAFANVGVPSARVELDALPEATERTRVFAGHAGWGPGQLDEELEREDWIVAAADADAVFSEDADDLWSEVLRRKGGTFAMLARMPLDPSVN